MRTRKSPGRAGRREVQQIRGKFRKKTSKSAFSPASRARCLRLCSARPPVAEVSNHRFGPGQRLAVWHGVHSAAAKESGDAIRGAGTMQLQPPRVGCACCTPCAATALRSRLTTPREALSVWWAQYEFGKSGGDNLKFELMCRSRTAIRTRPLTSFASTLLEDGEGSLVARAIAERLRYCRRLRS